MGRPVDRCSPPQASAVRLRENRSPVPDGGGRRRRTRCRDGQRYTGPGTLHRVTPDSESLRRRLVEDLSHRGLIRAPAVEDAFLRVPRERFVPDLARERGLEAVYRDEPLVIKMEDGLAVSSSSQPAIMAEMLERLELAPGQRVL